MILSDLILQNINLHGNQFREDFMNDMRILAEIRDVNIARIIAIVEEEPFSAIFEYGELGDLSSFLKNHDRNVSTR